MGSPVQGQATYPPAIAVPGRGSRLSDLLVTLPGVRRAPVESRLGSSEYVYLMRGVSTVNGKPCPVNVHVDGRKYDLGPEDLDRLAPPQEIEATEVHAGASQIPPRFAGPTAYCGVIDLWTRSSAIKPILAKSIGPQRTRRTAEALLCALCVL